MTLQTKRYIELGDILAIRFECHECHATLSLPIRGSKTNGADSCPNCCSAWVAVNGAKVLDITQFTEQIKKLDDVMKRLRELVWKDANQGFDLLVEIKAEVSDHASSDKD